jgi:hypothetical protein
VCAASSPSPSSSSSSSLLVFQAFAHAQNLQRCLFTLPSARARARAREDPLAQFRPRVRAELITSACQHEPLSRGLFSVFSKWRLLVRCRMDICPLNLAGTQRQSVVESCKQLQVSHGVACLVLPCVRTMPRYARVYQSIFGLHAPGILVPAFSNLAGFDL